MNEQIIITALLGLSFLVLFGVAELLYHYARVKSEITRKTVHIGTGILTLLFPVLLDSHWSVLFLCSSFALILFLSLKYDLLKSINAIGRKSYGSISYPVAVYVCFCFYAWHRSYRPEAGNGYILFYLPILILAICDPIAALFGRRWPYGKYQVRQETKTLVGSSLFFISAFFISFVLLVLLNKTQHAVLQTIIASTLIAMTTTVTEAICTKGTDNLFIPFTALFSLYFTLFLFY
jgi:dolichol kinase